MQMHVVAKRISCENIKAETLEYSQTPKLSQAFFSVNNTINSSSLTFSPTHPSTSKQTSKQLINLLIMPCLPERDGNDEILSFLLNGISQLSTF